MPFLVGGYFNIIRNVNDKCKHVVMNWSFVFNTINEYRANGRQHTWTHNMQDPTFEKLGIILICPNWEEK
jgi:hypothetical protein